MKQLFIYLCAITLCVFTSCSSDNDDEDEDKNDNIIQHPMPERKISKIEYLSSDGIVTDTEYITYKDNRWTKSVIKREFNDYQQITTISYRSKAIIITSNRYDSRLEKSETFALNDKGYIISRNGYEGHSSTFHYENGYLRSIDAYNSNYSARFNYSNENLVNIVDGIEDKHEYIITYSNIEDKMGINFIPVYYEDVIITFNNPLYQFGYFGKKSQYLAKSIKNIDNNEITIFDYELDSEGYVIAVNITTTWISGTIEYNANSGYKIYYE